jgi:histidine triad (HIT) family protein
MPSYDPNNIFTKILRGEIPSHKIYEDEHTFAFMDIMPQTDGHALVITKAGSRNLLDADPKVFTPLMTTVQKVARAAQQAFGVEGVLIKQFNEADAGQTVYHLHVHVIPRPAGTPLKPHSGQMADHALLAEQATRYRAALARG